MSKGMPTALDLFAGAGGATQGLRDAGFDVVAAVENDRSAAVTWRMNHPGLLVEEDIRDIDAADMLRQLRLRPGQIDLLKACPPCQGFSSLRGRRPPDKRQNDLVLDALRLVDGTKPKAVLLENVPGLRSDPRFETLALGMRARGYTLRDYLVEASALGVPQRRRRLVVIAIHGLATPLPDRFDALIPVAARRAAMTAGEALAALAAELAPGDPWHRWRQSSDIVARRIRAVPVNGTRFDLPEDLRLACHERLKGPRGTPVRAATGSYGRVRAEQPAPTMTTRCTTPASGPFIHPTEHRGLSLREAAALQTFPASYRWHGGHDSVERQIGNALPVWMAEALGLAVLRILGLPVKAESAGRAGE
jgi:DNA (cytosine-5)-methyltransferase 1